MNVKTSTIVRTIVLALTLINNALTIFDINPLPFSEEELYEIVSGIATVGVSLWAWWKNNSFTAAAIEADRVLAELKAQKIGNENEGIG